MTIKKILILTLILSVGFCFSGCGKKQEVESENQISNTKATHQVAIEVENYGVIELELYGDIAPITVKNFVELANDGFYDGLTFHRVIQGFMIQGGDPNGDGTGGSGKPIKGEFTNNGVVNNLSHERGVISMARSSDKNSASSQFFIMHETSTHLDGDYAAFGKVTSGMDVVDNIATKTKVSGYNGEVLPENQPIIKTITVK